jgi:hypothetical protein
MPGGIHQRRLARIITRVDINVAQIQETLNHAAVVSDALGVGAPAKAIS